MGGYEAVLRGHTMGEGTIQFPNIAEVKPMRNLPLICGLALVGYAMGADLPICEEFEG